MNYLSGTRASVAIVVGLVVTWWAPVARAQDAEDDQVFDETVDVTISGTKDPGAERMRRTAMESGRYASTGEALTEIPGVWVVRRGAAAGEPVIRGLGWERVVTQVGHLPLYGACAGHMDPPVTYVRPQAVSELLVFKGLVPVTLGPPSTGGRVVVDTDPRRDAGQSAAGGWLRSSVESARDGVVAEAGVHASNEWLDARGALEWMRFGDYTSPDGVLVPAAQREWSGAISLGVSPADGHRSWHTIGYVRHEGADYPALPMDLVETDAWTYDGGYRIALKDPVLVAAELGFGSQRVDHVMSNEHKPNRNTLAARTDSQVRAYAGVGMLTWALSKGVELKTGVDAALLRRDASRVRFLVVSGQRFEDHLWPDARQRDLGAFAQVGTILSRRWDLRVGARVDHVASAAGAWNDPGMGAATIADGFVRFYGEDANERARTEVVGGGNAVVTYEFVDHGATWFGVGRTARPGGITERYFAFAPAPGGFQVGNPAIEAEKKSEVEWGVRWQHPLASGRVSLFYNAFDDYILPTTLSQLDVNGDGAVDRIEGFRNVSARLFGMEVSGAARIGSHVTVPLAFAAVRGDNTTDGRPLPEIPPWEGRAAVRVGHGQNTRVWGQVGARVAGAQRRIDEVFGEDETDGFLTMHVRAGARLADWGLQLEGGVENLLNAAYHEHLTREAVLAVGGLGAGDEIPAPGRSVYVGARLDY